MSILLTGAAGVLGRELWAHLLKQGVEVQAVDIVHVPGATCVDLRNILSTSKLMESARPEAVIHLAANKNVGFCEDNPAAAHKVNYGITENLIKGCAEYGVRMVYFSSDYVFGEKDLLWNEEDSPCPTTQYGRDKVLSESRIHDSLVDYAIIRTAGLFGFPGDLVTTIYAALLKNKPFNAFENLINCPTWTSDLFMMLDAIQKRGLRGVFHCVGQDTLSRFDYACSVAEAYELDKSLIRREKLDFTNDIRPASLRLSGASTYKLTGHFPGTFSSNLRKISQSGLIHKS